MFPVLKSLYDWIDSISDLTIYRYYNSLLDISKVYECTSKVALPLGTETSFVVVDNTTSKDLIGLEDTLVNRYILISNPLDFIAQYIRIIAYNDATGEITLDNAFGFALTTSNTFDIVFLDTLFIDTGSSFQPYRKKSNTDVAVPVYLYFQTKNDSTKEKIFDYICLVETDFIKKNKRLPIYDNTTICGYMKCYDSINKDPRGNYSDQLQKYTMSFQIRYTMNYTK